MPGPPLILPASVAAGVGSNRRTLRRKLADELGFYHETTVSTQATSGEAARVVLADELRDDEIGYELIGKPWLYVRDGAQAGAQRRMLDQPDVGYQGSVGGVVLSRPFSSALAAGTAIEITSPLPAKRHLTIKGLNEIIDEALERIWVPARLSLTGNGTYAYDLAAYPWLLSEDQIQGVYDTRWLDGAVPPELSAYGVRMVTNGVARTLVTERSYSSADTFELAVVARGDRLVSDGTTWSYATTPGLQNDSYQTAAPDHWVLAFGMVKALQHLTKLVQARVGVDPRERQQAVDDLMERRKTWARAAARIKLGEFPKAPAVRTRSMMVEMPELAWS